MSVSKIRIYNPVYQEKSDPSTFLQPAQIDDLKGKTVVIIDNAWWIWEQTLPTLTEALKQRYGVAKTIIFKHPRGALPPGELEKAAQQGDCVILCLAMGGPEIEGVAENSIRLAKTGLPTVTIVVEEDPHFLVWKKVVQSRRVNLPIVTIPKDPEKLPVETAIGFTKAIIGDIVKALKNPPELPTEATGEPFLEVPDSPDEQFEILHRLGYTDGLPVIPPTEERVSRMIAYTHLDAGEMIGELPPFRGPATVQAIAVNAVMAGCRPEYMPVLMAMVRSCGDKNNQLFAGLTGGIPVTMMAVVNGPIRHDLDINCLRGLMGPGRRSNSALGRALQFMLRNIGGATIDVTMPGNTGHPGGYAFCFGENEEENPWEPLHEERGFSRQTNAVTVTNASSLISVATYTYDWKTMLTVMADSVAYFGNALMLHGSSPVWIFLTPEHAARLAKKGLSKKDVKEFIWEKARIPESQLPAGLVPYPHTLSITNGYIQVMNSVDEINLAVVARPDVYYAVTALGANGVTKPIS